MATGQTGIASPSTSKGAEPSTLSRALGHVSLVVKLLLFALVFMLAVKNSEPVTLRFFLGHELITSLALALVAAVCLGALLGVLAMVGYALRLRREAARARAELATTQADMRAALAGLPAVTPGVIPGVIPAAAPAVSPGPGPSLGSPDAHGL